MPRYRNSNNIHVETPAISGKYVLLFLRQQEAIVHKNPTADLLKFSRSTPDFSYATRAWTQSQYSFEFFKSVNIVVSDRPRSNGSRLSNSRRYARGIIAGQPTVSHLQDNDRRQSRNQFDNDVDSGVKVVLVQTENA